MVLSRAPVIRLVVACALLPAAVGTAPAVAKRPEIPGVSNKGPKVRPTPDPVIEIPTVTPTPTVLPTPTPSSSPSGDSGGSGSGSSGSSGSGGKVVTTQPKRTPTPAPTRAPTPAKTPVATKSPDPVSSPVPRKPEPVVTPGLPGAVATPVAALPVVSDVSGTPTVSAPTAVGDAPTFARTPDGAIVVVRRSAGGRGRTVTPVSPSPSGASSGGSGSASGAPPRVLSTFGPSATPVTQAIGGVFGAIPAALLGAVPTGDVAGALQRGGSSAGSSPASPELATNNEPREALSGSLDVIEQVTGTRIHPLLIIAALAALAGAFAVGIRRELRR